MQQTTLLHCLLLCICVSSLTSCGFSEIRRQANTVESTRHVSGQVAVNSDAQGTIYVQAYLYNEHRFERVRHHPAAPGGDFRMNLLPGTYAFSAFVDENHNAQFDPGEHGYYPGMEERYPEVFDITADSDLVVPVMYISGEIRSRADVVVTLTPEQKMKNTGTVLPLDDPMFDKTTARMALLQPVDFAQQFGGGVIFLQPYEASKIPVVFVHGIGGSAREFSNLIASLDNSRFQPWVYQYASGKPLNLVSDFLVNALSTLHAKHGFAEVVLIAHSMGGLMSRDYVLQHASGDAPYRLTMAMTINSPLLGMDSAEKGTRFSPIVIPSWRDVATGSAFIERVHGSPWPAGVPYHLVFSYLPGKTGDGVVPLSKQLNQALQNEAHIRGFEAGHATILKEPVFIDYFTSTLDGVARTPAH